MAVRTHQNRLIEELRKLLNQSLSLLMHSLTNPEMLGYGSVQNFKNRCCESRGIINLRDMNAVTIHSEV